MNDALTAHVAHERRVCDGPGVLEAVVISKVPGGSSTTDGVEGPKGL